jgi:hypothetical protein
VNQKPIPDFAAVPQTAALLVLFDASLSNDPDGVVTAFEWDFGDGTTGTGRTVLHAYPREGSREVTLTITDDAGERASALRWVSVSPTDGLQLPGDLTQDGALDISDAIGLLWYLFVGDGPVLPCGLGGVEEAGNRALLDATGDGPVDVSDALHVLRYLFTSGPPHAGGSACMALPSCPWACRE